MKTMRKIACALITALLVLATGVTGLSHGFTASADEGCTITITNAREGETYSAYKIFDVVSVSDDESAYSYAVDDSWKTFISGYKYCAAEEGCCSEQYQQCTCAECECCSEDGCCVNLFTLNDDGYLLASSAVFDFGDDSKVLIYFAAAAEAYAEENEISASATATCGETEEETEAKSVTIGNLDPGWYLVTGTASSTICMLEAVTSEATIEDKFGTPTLEKNILEDEELLDEETAENAEKVTYQITLSGVYGANNLVLHDALPGGLTLNADSIIVTLCTSKDITGTTLTAGTGYTVSTEATCSENNPPFSEGYSCSFEIDFSESYNTIIEKGSSAYIVITYTCTVDATKGEYDGDVESLINEVAASYGTNSWTTVDNAEVDTFEFEIDKVNSEGAPLAGAKFIIQNEDGYVATFDTDIDDNGSAVYIFKGWMFVSGITDAEEFAVSGATGATKDSSETTATSNTAGTNGSTLTATNGDGTTFTNDVWVPDYYLVTPSTGTIVVQGMDAGTYTLTETEAPEGYNKLEKPITVTIAYESGAYTLTVDTGNSEVIASEHTIEVFNNTGSILPGTGGIGTTIFYIVGGVIIIVAVVLLVTRRRVGAKDDK